MIIRHPTGFYGSLLPQKPSDGGNVTYTISSSDPERPQLSFTKIPLALAIRAASDRVYTDEERTVTYSKLAHTTSKSSASKLGTTVKQFEIGELIDFGTISTAPTVRPMLVSDETGIRHDTNLLDLTTLGVTSDEQDVVTRSSNIAFKSITQQLTTIVQGRANTETELSTTQKLLNETNKALNAVNILIAAGDGTGGTDPSLDNVRIKLAEKKESLNKQLSTLATLANTQAVEAESLQNKLLQLSQLVR